jgi:hypothetical protein
MHGQTTLKIVVYSFCIYWYIFYLLRQQLRLRTMVEESVNAKLLGASDDNHMLIWY